MDGVTRADLQGVVAPLNFMQPMAEKPYSYIYEPPQGVPARSGLLIEYKVTMTHAQMTSIRWIFLGAMPGGILLLGGLVWLRRRH